MYFLDGSEAVINMFSGDYNGYKNKKSSLLIYNGNLNYKFITWNCINLFCWS